MASLVPDGAMFSFIGGGGTAAAGALLGSSPPRLPRTLTHRLRQLEGSAVTQDLSLSLGMPSAGKPDWAHIYACCRRTSDAPGQERFWEGSRPLLGRLAASSISVVAPSWPWPAV